LPFPTFFLGRSAELSALCRTKCQVGRGAVWDGAHKANLSVALMIGIF
jgi:hypothetical protein